MSTPDEPNGPFRAMLTAPAATRALALENWFAAQPDADLAARVLSRALAAMEKAPYPVEGMIAGTELAEFLDAERLRFPLDEAAEKCGDPVVQSELWRHASTSALVTGELADLPYVYARHAVRANPANEAAWSAFKDALYSDHCDLLEDIGNWIGEARHGKAPAELPRRAMAAARSVAEEGVWDGDDGESILDELTKLESELG